LATKFPFSGICPIKYINPANCSIQHTFVLWIGVALS
jgi:hypothetical protein